MNRLKYFLEFKTTKIFADRQRHCRVLTDIRTVDVIVCRCGSIRRRQGSPPNQSRKSRDWNPTQKQRWTGPVDTRIPEQLQQLQPAAYRFPWRRRWRSSRVYRRGSSLSDLKTLIVDSGAVLDTGGQPPFFIAHQHSNAGARQELCRSVRLSRTGILLNRLNMASYFFQRGAPLF